jgi:hypothetical protein
MKAKFLFITLTILILLPFLHGNESGNGRDKLIKAPAFTMESTTGKNVTEHRFKDKFYAFVLEGQAGQYKNIHVRRRMESFISMLTEDYRDKILFFTVADVSSYLSIIRGLIRSRVKSSEEKEKITIFMDFTGDILKKFELEADSTNFVLVDDKGLIRYKIRGVVSQNELDHITKYLIETFDVPYMRAPIDISPAYNSRGYAHSFIR